MENFLQFLQKAKQALTNIESYEKIHLVLGNESCDLDSTISAISLAYLKHWANSEDTNFIAIPIMNVESKYFPLRTEICYLLEKYGIDRNLLVYRDQIKYSNFSNASKMKTTLVDHHVLTTHDKILEKTVVEIFDHRTINLREICQNDNMESIVIKTVGSCCTLIANEIIQSKIPLFSELGNLLYATIIYDTIGLDKDSGKTFDEDVTVAQQLESVIKPTQTRKELFDHLWKIHNDTSSFSAKELLYRDVKIVNAVPISGLPMLVEDYLKLDNVDSAILLFAEESNSRNVVLMGIDASKEENQENRKIELLCELGEAYKEFRKKQTDLMKKEMELAIASLEKKSKENELIEAAYKKEMELREAKHALELENLHLKLTLAEKNTDYLRIARSLHVRCVAETFEKIKPILNSSNKDRFRKWKELVESKDNHPDVKNIQEAIERQGLEISEVPNTACDLFKKINSDVHNNFTTSCDLLVIRKKIFTPNENKLLNAIIECYPLSTTSVMYYE